MKRTLFFLMMFVLIFSFSSCGDDKDAEPEQISFRMLYNDRESDPFSSDWLILQEYTKRKGVSFDVTLGEDDDYERFINQAIESETPPDIILKVWPDQISAYAGRELLLPVSDYLDEMPYFTAYIEEEGLEEEIDRLRQDDGKIYILPGYQRGIQVQQWIYRKDLFEQYGLGTPSTYEELFDALVTLKDIYPDSTPIAACWSGAHLYAMMGAGYGIKAGWNGNNSFNEETGSWEYAPATPSYREMVRFLHRCHDAGLLSLEEFDLSFEEYVGRLTSNHAFFTPTWISSGFANWDAALADKGFTGAEWYPVPVLESTNGTRALPAVNRFRKGLVIPAAVKDRPHFQELLSFIDWAVYSPEGRELTSWGVEGVTFVKNGLEHEFLPEVSTGAEFGLELFFNLCENEEKVNQRSPEHIVEFLSASLDRDETLPQDPALHLSSLQLDAMNQIVEPINAYAALSLRRFVTGEMDIEEDWGLYIGELERLGYTSLEKILNDAHI